VETRPGSTSSRPSKNAATCARVRKVIDPAMAWFMIAAPAAISSAWMSAAGWDNAR
jgi:hypothetical protein